MGWTSNFGNPKGFLGKIFLLCMNIGHTGISSWAMSKYNWGYETKALDIGCGGGINMKRMINLTTNGKIIGIDISEECLKKSKKMNSKTHPSIWSAEYGCAEDIPLGSNYFDIVTAFETIYFWNDIPKAFSEVMRVLKPGGVFMAVNAASDPNSVWGKMIEGMKIRTPEELTECMSEIGFTDIITYRKHKSWYCILAKKPSGKNKFHAFGAPIV